jgi:hypothetical protein
MSDAYYRERCAILEKENAALKEELRKVKKKQKPPHYPNCDGDLWICKECRGIKET